MGSVFRALAVCLAFVLALSPCFAEQKSRSKKDDKEQAEKLGERIKAELFMERVGPVYSGRLARHASKTITVHLDQHRCYRFAVAGGDGVKDLSVSLSIKGSEIAGDKLSRKHPQIEWCAPDKMEVEVNITMYDGEGLFALVVFGKKGDSPRRVAKVGGAVDDFIANRIRQLHGKFSKSRSPIMDVERGNLSTGNEHVFKVKLKHNHCYTFIAAGSPSVRNLDITLYEPGGREIGSDSSKNSFPVLITDPCLRSSGQYTLKIRMFSGYGQFGVQGFSDK
jgi:hypothetical protein